MAFKVVTDDLSAVQRLMSDLIERSSSARLAIRKIGPHWKAIGCELSDKDADLLVPITPDDMV